MRRLKRQDKDKTKAHPSTVDQALPMPIRGLRGEAYRTGKAVYDNAFPDSKWLKYLPEGHAELRNVLFVPLVIEGGGNA